MKIYNKFVESKKEPQNKSDIWFDGSSWKMYKEGMWRAFTLPLDAAVEINKILQEDKSVLQQELKNYLKIQDSPFEKDSAENSAILKGGNNKATNANEVAIGRYNESNNGTQFSIGIGSANERKNAYEIMQDGEHYVYGIGGYDGTNPIESKDLATVINNLENKHPLLGFANDDINNSKSSLDFIYSLLKLGNLSPYIQGWGNFVCKDGSSFSGTYTILSVGVVNTKASAILKVVGSIFGSGFNSYIVQVSFSVDVNENYSNLEITATEEFNSTEVLNRITQLENKLNEITTND